MHNYDIKNRKLVFDGNLCKVYTEDVLYPNDKYYPREKIEHVPGVCIAALNDNNEIVFVNQYRHAMGKDLLELPAGKVDSYQENYLDAAKRELQEECGVIAKKFLYCGEFVPSGAYLTEIVHLFFATDLTYTSQHFDEDEFIEIQWIPLNKAIEMANKNEIIDGKTLALLYKVDYLLKDKTR